MAQELFNKIRQDSPSSCASERTLREGFANSSLDRRWGTVGLNKYYTPEQRQYLDQRREMLGRSY